MSKCLWTRKVESWLDGEFHDAAAVERHLASCTACAADAAQLRVIRERIKRSTSKETIAPAQLPAFLSGIRERIAQPEPRRRGFWAWAPLTIAALIVALFAFSLLTGGPREALATEIESVHTDLEGATVTSYFSKDGTATVKVTVPMERAP